MKDIRESQYPQRNLELLQERSAEFDNRQGIRVGDFLSLPCGRLDRFTHDWGEEIGEIQAGGSGNFFLGLGYVSYSGSLDASIPKRMLRDSGKKQKGSVWFFDGDFSGAGRGVWMEMEFRVFEIDPETISEFNSSSKFYAYHDEVHRLNRV